LPNAIAVKDIKNYLCKICYAFAPKMLLKLIPDCDIEVSNALSCHLAQEENAPEKKLP
jgi:hypothetical protein